jgi:nucleotide-binding universal stress UspA family protein
MYNHILVALDGSEPSRHGGKVALALAAAGGARITACHVYGVAIHRQRFSDMEPGLPTKYQSSDTFGELRSAHDRLIDEGFRALSAGYVEDFVALAHDREVPIDSVAVEGRSYVGILQLAESRQVDLIVLGAHGLGAVGDGMLGGTTSRVLLGAPCDVLVARRAPTDGPVMTGVDGSDAALEATARAADLAGALAKPVHLVAVYDPDFHTRVFNVMGRSLSAERQQEVGLANQERLHDDIITDGLGKLYAEFLSDAERHIGDAGVALTKSLATGKAYRALNAKAGEARADLIVISRHGHHREPYSRLGSNADAVVRTAAANVLLVGGADYQPHETQTAHAAESVPTPQALVWDPDAEARLHRVPSFVRNIARRAVENAVRELGKNRVSADDFQNVAAQFGMGRPGGST